MSWHRDPYLDHEITPEDLRQAEAIGEAKGVVNACKKCGREQGSGYKGQVLCTWCMCERNLELLEAQDEAEVRRKHWTYEKRAARRLGYPQPAAPRPSPAFLRGDK